MCEDYFEKQEQENTEEIKARLAEKVENMNYVAPAEKKDPDFSQVELLRRDEAVLINSEMLKNALNIK